MLIVLCLSRTARGEGVFFSAGAGLFEYLSPGISEINKRLGNSPLLKVREQHTGATGFDGSVFFLDKYMNLGYTASFLSISEDISANNSRARMRSSLAVQGIGFGATARLYPFVRNATMGGGGGGKSGPGRRAPSRNRLYVLGIVEAWPLLISHRYSLKVAEMGTDIAYGFHAFHGAAAVRGQVGYALTSSLHVYLRASYLGSHGFFSQTTVSRLTLQGLDYRFRSSRLDLDALSKAGLECVQAAVGVTFAL